MQCFIGLTLEEVSKLRFGNAASKLIILNTFCNFESVFGCVPTKLLAAFPLYYDSLSSVTCNKIRGH